MTLMHIDLNRIASGDYTRGVTLGGRRLHLGVDHRASIFGDICMHIFSRWQHLNSHTLGASQTVIQRKFLKVPETIDCERKKWVLNQK